MNICLLEMVHSGAFYYIIIVHRNNFSQNSPILGGNYAALGGGVKLSSCVQQGA